MLNNLSNQSYINHTTCSSTKSHNNNAVVIAKGDSGASSHYIRPQDERVLNNVQHRTGPEVTQPDGTNLNITGTGDLPLHKSLSAQARKGHILPNLTSSSLVALGPLCDDGCTVILTDKTLTAVKNNNIVLRGHRNRSDDLWDIPLYPHTKCMDNVNLPLSHSGLYVPPHKRGKPPDIRIKKIVSNNPPTLPKNHKENFQIKSIRKKKINKMVKQQLQRDADDALLRVPVLSKNEKISVILRKKETRKNLARYLHAACFSPVKSTWEKAIDNKKIVTWPGLTSSLIRHHLSLSPATVQGHLHSQRKNLQSTKPPTKLESNKDVTDHFPTSSAPVTKSNQVVYVLIDKSTISTAYQDLTGRFPFKSSSGNEYVLIGYHYDANCIVGHPVKD